MVERQAFLMKPKHQCHLSHRVERVYGAQSWKEKVIVMWFDLRFNWQTNFDSKK